MDAKCEIVARIEAAKRAGGNVETAVVDYNAGRIDVSPETRAAIPSVSIPSVYLWCRQIHKAASLRLAGRYGNRAGTGLIDSQPPLAVALRALLCDKPHIQSKHAAEFLAARYADSGLRLPAYRRCAAGSNAGKPRITSCSPGCATPMSGNPATKAPSATPPPISCG